MPHFKSRYEVKQSPVHGLFVRKPMISVRVYCVDNPMTVACNLRMRLDTGATISALPYAFVADVLDMPFATDAQVGRELARVMHQQGLSPINLTSASGQAHTAYPLRVPVDIEDDHGAIGAFEALLAFVDGQDPGSLLAGLVGFLDKFDVHLLARGFELAAHPNSGVTCPYASCSSAHAVP